MRSSPYGGLTFRKLDVETMKVVVHSDGSFSSKNGGSSQVRGQIFIVNKSNNANLVDFASVKSIIVVRSSLGAETFGISDACDAAILIHHYLKLILKLTLKIVIITDRETFFNIIIRNGPATEKRQEIYDRY